MANNRLYLYDPESNQYLMLAKGRGSGWVIAQTDDDIDEFFEGRDIAGALGDNTSLQLLTESNLPSGAVNFRE